MLIAFLASVLASQAAAPPAPPPPQGEDIIVQAVRGECRLQHAGGQVSVREVARMAEGWPAGTPLRIKAPLGADYPCLTRIVLKLNKRGVRNVLFVD